MASTSLSTDFYEEGCRDELDPGPTDCLDLRAGNLSAALPSQRPVASLGQSRLPGFHVRRCVRRAAAQRHDGGSALARLRPGTDLMLYALIIAFSFSTLNTYLRFKDL